MKGSCPGVCKMLVYRFPEGSEGDNWNVNNISSTRPPSISSHSADFGEDTDCTIKADANGKKSVQILIQIIAHIIIIRRNKCVLLLLLLRTLGFIRYIT